MEVISSTAKDTESGSSDLMKTELRDLTAYSYSLVFTILQGCYFLDKTIMETLNFNVVDD